MKWARILASLLLVSPSWGAVALVSGAHVIAQSATSNTITSGSVDTTGSNFLVLTVARSGAAVITDSKSNVWTARTAYTTSGINQQLYYSTAPVVGTGHTFTATCTGCFPSIAIQGFSGVNVAAFDAESGFGATGVTTIQPGNVAPSEDNELLISGHTGALAGSMSIDSGFTITDQAPLAGGVAYGVALAYIIKGAGTAGINVNPTWTSPGSDTSMASLAAFKAGASSTPSAFGIINNPTGRF